MEARRGIADPKKGQEPGPGAYYEGVPGEASQGSDPGSEPRRVRKVFPPSSFFRSTVPKERREGSFLYGPGDKTIFLSVFPCGAPCTKDIMVAQYQKDGQVQPEESQSHRYKLSDVTGGKVKGTFNRVAVEAYPASGKPKA
ncbi:dnaJ [Symbiodinium sp. KB8]|nr:dnaJ [Symbiodinium sp. KB8]